MKRISRDIHQTEKECSKCHRVLPKDQYWIDTTNNCLYSRCKGCHTLTSKDWGARNPEKKREHSKRGHRKIHFQAKNYGITPARYEEMGQEQNWLCAICHQPETKKNKQRLSIDHDHETKQVRELLCDRCNNLLGRAGDSEELLLKAVIYLRKHKIPKLEIVNG